MLGASWKVKLFAIGVLTLSFLGPILDHYVPVFGLNWVVFLGAVNGILTGGALLLTKQYDVHGGTVDTGTRPPGSTPPSTFSLPGPKAEGIQYSLYQNGVSPGVGSPSQSRRIEVSTEFIKDHNLVPSPKSAYVVHGEDGQIYALDDVLIALIREYDIAHEKEIPVSPSQEPPTV